MRFKVKVTPMFIVIIIFPAVVRALIIIVRNFLLIGAINISFLV